MAVGDDPFAALGDLDEIDRGLLAMLVAGHPNRAIGRSLHLPEGTVKWRLHRLYRRAGVTSRLQLALLLQRKPDTVTHDDPANQR